MLLICLCSLGAILVSPVVSVKSITCTENGDCIDKNVELILANENDSNNETNSTQMPYYEVTDDFGNIYNISVVDIKTLLSTLIEKSNNYDKIQKDVNFVFQGVIIAVILFGVCASICVITACIYCCRINITDNRLKSDVEALAEKLKRDCRFKKSMKRTTLEPVSESCNIINANAGVFCV